MKIEKEFLSSALFDKASSQYVAVDLKSRVGIWLSFEVFLILFYSMHLPQPTQKFSAEKVCYLFHSSCVVLWCSNIDVYKIGES